MAREQVRVKIFGERNTGTRAVIRMLEQADNIEEFVYPEVPEAELAHYDSWIAQMSDLHKGPWRRVFREAIRDLRQDYLGPLGAWKHAAPRYDPAFAREGLAVIFLIRNPYSWLLALHRRPYHGLGRRDGDFETFLARPWATLRRDAVAPILPTPMDLWNAKMRAYPQFITQAAADGVPTAFLKFEDFVHAPAHALKSVLRSMSLDASGIRPARPTKPMGRKARERRDYYGRERWRTELSANAIAAINAAIDWDVAAHYGYARLPSGSDRKTRPATAA